VQLGANLELDNVLTLLHSVGLNLQLPLTDVAFLLFEQVLNGGLTGAEHDLTELDGSLSDQPPVFISFEMPNLEQEVQVLVENVFDAEMLDPLWVEVVIDDFRFTSRDPGRVLLVALSDFECTLRV
jgi:hypothetical protein